MENVKKLVDALSQVDEDHLYAGLTLISRTIDHKTDCEDFIGQRHFFAFPELLSMPMIDLTQFENGEVPELLLRPEIKHEYTYYPGKEIFEKFSRKFKETICGKDGPYEQFCNGLVGQADLPVTIAASILSGGQVWLPIAVYVGLLIVKTGLKTYCEI